MNEVSKQNRRLRIAAGLLIAVILLFAATRKEERPGAPIQFTFLKFTNSGIGPEAIFLVQVPEDFPAGSGWRNPEVSFEKGGVWTSWSPTNAALSPMRFLQAPTPLIGASAKRFEFEAYVAFMVRATNENSRFVIQVDESLPVGPLYFLRRWLGMSPVMPPTGRSYSLTNDAPGNPVVK